MNQYRKLLVLQYLDEKKDNYTIQEIFAILGFEVKAGIELLGEMFEEELIEYNEYCLISVSSKGMQLLNKKQDNQFKIYEGNIFLHEILPKLKKDDIYIPRKL